MFSNILKERSHYENLKSRIGKYNVVWKRLSGRPYVGDCSYLYEKLKPESYQDFFDKYLSYINPKEETGLKRSKFYGRTIENLADLAKEYQRSVMDPEFTLEDYFDDIVCHVIIETFDGHKAEKQLIDVLNRSGFKAYTPNGGNIDAEMGVDIIVTKDGTTCDYIQVKPISTFTNNHNASLIADRVNFFSKQAKLDEYIDSLSDCTITKHNIIYMLYDYKYLVETGEVEWFYKDGKAKFMLNELIDTNGHALNTVNDFFRKKLVIK